MALHHSSNRPAPMSQQGMVPSGQNVGALRPGRLLLTVDQVAASNVVNRVGEDYGKIESTVFDFETGHLAYAILSYGGWSGFGLRYYAVPWRALEIDWDRRCFVLDLDREHLKAAPGWQQGHWPAFEDEGWAREVHAHYGVTPYWE